MLVFEISVQGHPGLLERLGPLTYLVQVTSGVFWRRHVDHLKPLHDGVNVQDQHRSTSPPLPDSPVPTEFIPVPGADNAEPSPAAVRDSIVEQAPSSTTG